MNSNQNIMFVLSIVALFATCFARVQGVADGESPKIRAERDWEFSRYAPAPLMEASTLEETQHVVPLTRNNRPSRSSKYSYALRTGKRLPTAPVMGVFGGEEFVFPIEFGGQSSYTIMDTGSANIWVAEKGFTCVNQSGAKISEKSCRFGPLYKPTEELIRIPDQNFNSTYADGEGLVGYPALETVEIAGISVPKQEIGVVNHALWDGDGISSGLTGLAYPVVTSVFKGNNATHDKPWHRINYNPIFTTMYQRGLVKPVFSVELGHKGSPGRLALGGIPSGYANASFASAPIEIVNFTSFGSATQYSFYTVNIDGFVVANASSGEKRFIKPRSSSSSRLNRRGVIKADFPGIIDSGTTLAYVDNHVASIIASQFEPAGYFQNGYFMVNCQALKPLVGIVIGGREFYIHPGQLIYGHVRECISGFQGTIAEDPPLRVLGDAFLQSVLAVFDVGASKMSFAQR